MRCPFVCLSCHFTRLTSRCASAKGQIMRKSYNLIKKVPFTFMTSESQQNLGKNRKTGIGVPKVGSKANLKS